MKVSALEYVPVRSASLALTSWDSVIVTLSLETGAVHVDFEKAIENGWGSAKAPLTSLFVLVVLGSLHVSDASPAEEMTLAAVLAV